MNVYVQLLATAHLFCVEFILYFLNVAIQIGSFNACIMLYVAFLFKKSL